MSLDREPGYAQAWRQEYGNWAKNGTRKETAEMRLTGKEKKFLKNLGGQIKQFRFYSDIGGFYVEK